MKSLLIFCCLVTSSLVYAQSSADEKTVLEVEKQRFEAQVSQKLPGFGESIWGMT
jgi:S-adenosylmethionine synthetase